jgi:coenzyme F420-reducing hydrogenase beta subunit
MTDWMPPQAADLSGVRASDMCIGCGACVHADPSLQLVLHPEKQIWEPSHDGNELAALVCPAVQVDFPALHREIFGAADPGPYGVVDSVMLGQSTDLDRNLKASSGGLIKELLIELLGRPDVDGAVVLVDKGGLVFEPEVITEPEQADSLPGSIYHNLPKDRVLQILKEEDRRLVLVGIPCEFEGIFQYILRVEPHLRERIHTTIGLLCGWQYNYHALRAISEYLDADFDDIQAISYRGGGPVGKLRIQTSEKEHSASRRVDFGYQVAFDRTFNTPRCHLCVNHANFLADIVVGDAWLPSTVGTKTGISLIINRRPSSTALMKELESKGRIVLSEVTTEEIKESQKPAIAFGDFAYSYAQYLDEIGVHRPVMEGPNRPAATLVPRSEVEYFHSELVIKTKLQRQRKYRRLFWRKATKELPRLVSRYWNWFAVRILRIKSLKGERQELSRDQVSMFR